MNSSKYPMCSYVPIKPKSTRFYDLHQRLQEMTFEEIVNNPPLTTFTLKILT